MKSVLALLLLTCSAYASDLQINQITSLTLAGATSNVFDPETDTLFVASADGVTVFDMSDPKSLIEKTESPLLAGQDVPAVALNGMSGLLAILTANGDAPGDVYIFDRLNLNNPISTISVGVTPGSLVFNADGTVLLVTNEGEPENDTATDPEGSVSVIDLSDPSNPQVETADFTAFNTIITDTSPVTGVRIREGRDASTDLEPDFIAISEDGQTAYVTLQENNAIAILDVQTAIITDVVGLGVKNYAGRSDPGIDVSSADGKINIRNWPLLGLYQPSWVQTFTSAGTEYLITANEGDERDSEETTVGELTIDPEVLADWESEFGENIQADENMGGLLVTNQNGDIDGDGDFDDLYSFGGRSVSIWDVSGNLVWDSRDDIERATAMSEPSRFNGQSGSPFDVRSPEQGAEPEVVITAELDGVTYAFIALERIGGFMVYDVTNATQPRFIRWFSDPLARGFASPDALLFIPADESPNDEPLLVVSYEFSGHLAVYQLSAVCDCDGGSSGGGGAGGGDGDDDDGDDDGGNGGTGGTGSSGWTINFNNNQCGCGAN